MPSPSPSNPLLPDDLVAAVRASQSKKAEDIRIFDLRGVTSLTEFFLLCSGTNQRQNQAISDEILKLLKDGQGRMPLGVEGYDKADWILMDYGDFIVHILSGQARKYYDLERLWRQARELPVPEDATPSAASGAAS
jgi:ribosome-associated protein